MKTTLRCRTGAFALVACFPAVLTGCVNQQQRDIQTVDDFKRNTAGQYQSDSGAQLFIVPVRSRMVTDESMYIERHDANGIFGDCSISRFPPTARRCCRQRSTFTQEGQWRNLRENPELFTALLPKDVRPAGTCDIQPAEDLNSVSYSCGGSKPEVFRRQ